MFEFPNGSDLLQLIDGPLAGLERFRPMLGAGDDQDDILPDRNFAVPVDDQEFQNAEILERPLADLAQLLLLSTSRPFERSRAIPRNVAIPPIRFDRRLTRSSS
jgi:hypothetical protein